jgi:hypothetical protein
VCEWVETYGSILRSFRAAALERHPVALVLETLRSDQALDLGGLGVRLRALLLGLDLAANDELANLNFTLSESTFTNLTLSDSALCDPRAGHAQDWRRSYEVTHIIFLAEAEEAADLGGALGTETLGGNVVGDAGDVFVALLDDAQGEDSEVHADNAAADRLPLALAGAAGTVARVALGEQQADTGGVHDTLLHGEALLVVAAGDLEDIALELITDAVAGNLVSHAAFHEDAKLALIFNLNQLLGAVGRVRDVELHLDGVVEMASVATTLVESRGLNSRVQSTPISCR